MPDDSPITGTTPPTPSVAEPQATPDAPQGNPGQSVQNAVDAFSAYKAGTLPEAVRPKPPAETPPAAPEGAAPTKEELYDVEPEGTTELEPGTEEPQVQGQSRSTRDYSDIAPEDVPYFRQMSRKAFEFLKPRYVEAQKLKADYEALQAKATDFQALENAYQLTPEYRTEIDNISYLDTELAHWRQQLVNIRTGKPWTPIVLNEKGNPVRGQPIPPPEPDPTTGARPIDEEAAADVIMAMQKANTLREQCQARAMNLKDSYANQHKQFNDGLAAARKEIFKGIDDKQLKSLADTKLPLFPPALRGDPKVRIIAELLAVIDGFDILLKQAKGQTVAATTQAQTTANAGPRPRTMQSGTKPNTVAAGLAKFDAWKRGQGGY